MRLHITRTMRLGCAWRWRQLRTQSVFVLSETSLQAVRCTGASQPADCHYEQSHGLPARRFRRRGQSRRQRCRVLPTAASLRAERRFWPSKRRPRQWRRRPRLRARRHTGHWNSCLPVHFWPRTSGTKNAPPRLSGSYRREVKSHE